MTEHLPECRLGEPCDIDIAEHGFCSMQVEEQFFCIHCMGECICERLRSCEQRVIDAAVQRVEALPHALECVTRDANYNRPCNCLHGDALDAVKGDQP
jgi:hypothetical protein